MSFEKIRFRPGINTQATPLLNEGGFSDCNLVRFRNGLPEIYGGWTPYSSMAVQGVCRGSHAWETLAGLATLGAGTSLRLYVLQGGSPFDITPVAQTTTPTNPFTTTMSSTTVTVSDSALTAQPTVGTFIEISGGSAVGGLTLSGEYQIASIIGPTSYTITAANAATSGATGGGTPTIEYLLPAGYTDAPTTAGWGAGAWGAGTWGTPRASSQTVPVRTWAIDNFGEIMVANPRGAGIYVWLPSAGLSVRAVAMTNAPAQCNYAFVSSVAQQVIALGCNPPAGGAFDPMLVSWCDEGDYTTWIASPTNAAGSFPLTDGSQLMWGGRAGQQNLIWSDTALYSMQFVSGQNIYGFQPLGTACGLISPNAACIVNGMAFWMSGMNFMSYTGTVQPIPCTVRDKVYLNLNLAQASKIMCGLSAQFSEVRWDFPSANATENDSYVIFNYQENDWYVGGNVATSMASIARTSWIDANVFGNPISFDANGQAWSHENGYSAGGLPLPWFLTSGEFDLANGEDFMFVDMVLPDQKLTGGSIGISVEARDYSNDAFTESWGNPFQVTPSTEFFNPELRGRQMRIRWDNSFNAVGAFWRLGALRIRSAPDGRSG